MFKKNNKKTIVPHFAKERILYVGNRIRTQNFHCSVIKMSNEIHVSEIVRDCVQREYYSQKNLIFCQCINIFLMRKSPNEYYDFIFIRNCKLKMIVY